MLITVLVLVVNATLRSMIPVDRRVLMIFLYSWNATAPTASLYHHYHHHATSPEMIATKTPIMVMT